MTKPAFLGIALLLPAVSHAELSLLHFFSDHMVLQRDWDASVWRTAYPNAEVTLRFGKSSVATMSDENGNWKVLHAKRNSLVETFKATAPKN